MRLLCHENVISLSLNFLIESNFHFQDLEHGHDDAGEHVVPSKHLLGGAAQDVVHRPRAWLYQGARHERSCRGEGVLSLIIS